MIGTGLLLAFAIPKAKNAALLSSIRVWRVIKLRSAA